jgi:outer membrane lipoprotein-sorting protein
MRRWAAAGCGVIGVAMGAVALSASAQAANDAQLTKVLAQLDAASARFKSAQADFSWTQYTAIVQENDVQKGTIAFRRDGSDVEMVVHVKTDNDQPAPKDVLYKNGELDLYQPTIHQETVLSAGKDRQSFEGYATLGFGASGKALTASWDITDEGTDTIDGTKVDKLNLVPKHPSANEMFTHIEIWIDPETATSKKQVFYTSSGDTRTTLYSGLKMNSAPESLFTLKVPHGTQVIRK